MQQKQTETNKNRQNRQKRKKRTEIDSKGQNQTEINIHKQHMDWNGQKRTKHKGDRQTHSSLAKFRRGLPSLIRVSQVKPSLAKFSQL